MNKNLIQTLLALALLLSLGACSSSTKQIGPKKDGYRTIAAEIGRNTDQARTLTARAAVAIKEGRHDEAEQILRDALTQDVMYGPAHNNLGQLYYQQQRYYEAAWEFQYAIRLMPHQPIPRNNLGLVFEATGRLDEAAEQYGLAVAEEPDNPELLGNLARAQLRRGDRGPEVREILQQIVVKDTRTEWRKWAEEQLYLLPKDQ
ncbi:MAG: tetratricopeptide repeat protein [Phycisphaeraceae bacterium]|nr:tetratricopeptide repeat protein [Phycisphaeraceae bacterium]